MQNKFRDAIPAIDRALRAAGVQAPGNAPVSAVSQLFGADTAKQKQPGAKRKQQPDTAGLNAPGPLSSLLYQGALPGEYLVPVEQVPVAESLLARPEVQRLVPRGIELKWGTEDLSRGARSFQTLYAVEDRPIITGDELEKATARRDQLTNQSVVDFVLSRRGGRTFERETGRHVNDYMAIILDGRVQRQPPVRGARGGGADLLRAADARGPRRLRLHADAAGARRARPVGGHRRGRERADLRAHPRGAAARQADPHGRGRGLQACDERHHRLQREHGAHGGDPLPRRDGPGAGLRDHAHHRHHRLHVHGRLPRAHLLHDLAAAAAGHGHPERLMIRLFANANYDFIKWRRWAIRLTPAFIVPGYALFFVRGLNYSIEFTGGTLIQVTTVQPVGTGKIRSALDAAGVRDAEIQQFGAANEYVVRARLGAGGVTAEGSTQATAQGVDSALARGLGADQYRIVRTEAVGPKVGRELQGKAFLAIFFSFIVTLVYLAIRFEWRFGLAAVLATFHDILSTIAFIHYLNLEVSLLVVGAVLTMVGYSLNDTIIIFDRVRENLRKFRRQNLYEILNLSINETLPRSVLTHGTTMATTIALVLLAGEVLRPFALVMTFAIFTGTFSSVYIAAPILMYIEKRWPGEDARGARQFRPGAAPASPAPGAPPRAPQPPQPQTMR